MRVTLALLLFPAMALAADVKVTPAEQQEEARWLQSLGIKPPAGPWPLDDPFTQPFTRRSLVVPTAWYRARPQTLRADLLREDVRLLPKIMETAYGGWDMARRRGWNWDAFFKEWDSVLAARGEGEMTLVEAFAQWRKYMEFQLDNHSGPAVGGSDVSGHAVSWSAVLAEAPSETCTEVRTAQSKVYPMDANDPAQRPRKIQDRLGRPVYYVVAPSGKGPIAAVHCGSRWIPAEAAWNPEYAERTANILALSKTADDAPAFRDLSPRIAYLRFPTFSKRNVERIMDLEKTLRGKPHPEELVIADLRSNDGGDLRIQALGNWIRFHHAATGRRLGESCLYPALRWGYMQMSGSGLKPPISDFTRGNYQSALGQLFEADDAACPAKFKETAAQWRYTDHRFPSRPEGKARVLALVDNLCGSDCEAAVEVLAQQPGTVIAGVNTVGVAQFIQPGYFVLPHSRAPFRIALGTADYYGDGRSFDGYGFDVDILLASRADQSPESIVQLAERLLGER